MALRTEEKQDIIKKFQRGDLDSGSSEVQIALLTERIQQLTEHFKTHKKDHHGRRGLVALVNRRRKLLDYVKGKDFNKYSELLQALGIRK